MATPLEPTITRKERVAATHMGWHHGKNYSDTAPTQLPSAWQRISLLLNFQSRIQCHEAPESRTETREP